MFDLARTIAPASLIRFTWNASRPGSKSFSASDPAAVCRPAGFEVVLDDEGDAVQRSRRPGRLHPPIELRPPEPATVGVDDGDRIERRSLLVVGVDAPQVRHRPVRRRSSVRFSSPRGLRRWSSPRAGNQWCCDCGTSSVMASIERNGRLHGAYLILCARSRACACACGECECARTRRCVLRRYGGRMLAILIVAAMTMNASQAADTGHPELPAGHPGVLHGRAAADRALRRAEVQRGEGGSQSAAAERA